jgi:hypothetical protein
LVITMPSVIQRGTETFRIRSVTPVDVPSTRRRKVPEGTVGAAGGVLDRSDAHADHSGHPAQNLLARQRRYVRSPISLG